MKKLFHINVLVFVFFAGNILKAQTVTKTFVPYYLDNDKVENFERVGAKEETRTIGFKGLGGENEYLTVFKKKYSAIRFDSYNMPKFIIELDPDGDPFELVVISKADVVRSGKTYRRFIQKGESAGGGAKDISKYVIVPELKKINGNLYEMVFEEELEPGEYSFLPIDEGKQRYNITSTSGDVRIYCFGID